MNKFYENQINQKDLILLRNPNIGMKKKKKNNNEINNIVVGSNNGKILNSRINLYYSHINNNNLTYHKNKIVKIKLHNDIPENSEYEKEKKEILCSEKENSLKYKMKKYLNHFRKLTTEIKGFNYKCNIENSTTEHNLTLKNMNPRKKMVVIKNKLFLKCKDNNKLKKIKNIKCKDLDLNSNNNLKTKIHCRNNNSEILPNATFKKYWQIKNNTTETEPNKNISLNKFNYLNNNKKKLKKEKLSLINKNVHYNKNHILNLKNKSEEYEEDSNFLKTELIDNLTKQKEFEKNQNVLTTYDLSNNHNLNLQKFFKENKNHFHLQNKSEKYNYNNSKIYKSLQKYFSLSPNDLNRKFKVKLTENNRNDNNYNKIKINKKDVRNFVSPENVKIAKIKYNNKIFKNKLQTTKDVNNNLIKTLFIKKSNKDSYRLHFLNKNKIIGLNLNKYSRNENNKQQVTLNIKENPNKRNFNFIRGSKSMSLNTLQELNDYIGPNQYRKIIIPTNKSKIINLISENKHRDITRKRDIYKTEEIEKNREYHLKIKNREIKSSEDYYNKKEFDKLVLSGEKKSKYYKMRNILYETAFKKCTY